MLVWNVSLYQFSSIIYMLHMTDHALMYPSRNIIIIHAKMLFKCCVKGTHNTFVHFISKKVCS